MAACLPQCQMKEDFKDEFLTCSICAELYDNAEHQAKCLPCLHTYCKSCLQRIAGKKSQFDCPTCRKLITLTGGTVDSLPNNFIVENLKEYQNIFNLAVTCGNCNRGDPAVRFCHDCGSFQCQRCTDNHQEMRSMQHHQLVTIEELQAKKCNPMMQQQQQHCTKHPKQDMTMYCKDCKVPVCATCGHLDHRGHDLIELSAAIEQIVADMQLSSKKVNERNQELARKRFTALNLQQTLTTNFKKKEKEMQESTQKLYNQIRANYNKTQAHLKHLYETEMNNLTASIESIDFLTAQMTSACEFANQSCDMSHPMQLITLENQIMERLNELEIAKLPETASDKTDFDFTEKHDSALAQIQKSLEDLCDIRWKPQDDPQRCTIQLGLPTGYQRLKATVQIVDTNGHNMTTGNAKVDATQGGNSLRVQNNHDGTYIIDYASCRGSQPVYVKINGMEMKGSPFNTLPEVDPRQCTIRLGLLRVSGNKHDKAKVQTVDRNGHNMTTGNAKVEAAQGGNSLRVQDNNDGTYIIDYASCRGSQPMYIKINGTEMKGSPFNSLSEVDPQRCTIQLGLVAYRYNLRKATAVVQTVDANGHNVTNGNAKVDATQDGNSLSVQNNHDGTYTIEYDSYYDNNFSYSIPLCILINGTHMTGSPFQTMPLIDLQKCTIRVGLPGVYGSIAIVQVVDVNGHNTINARVAATQDKMNALHVQDNHDGTYTIDYKYAGLLYVNINGTVMNGSPFKV
ncbi:E3 ubiquitin-protein ligase TRIM45-like [Amphiura filiformis]|uniref:E3 ubiquitin-protein ligase TRIM45-like n=1 Tax=Amphiura filiformis TaxID=82378 RepID=UPI003B20BBD7